MALTKVTASVLNDDAVSYDKLGRHNINLLYSSGSWYK
jgi:hypothetical protein